MKGKTGTSDRVMSPLTCSRQIRHARLRHSLQISRGRGQQMKHQFNQFDRTTDQPISRRYCQYGAHDWKIRERCGRIRSITLTGRIDDHFSQIKFVLFYEVITR